MVPASAGGHPTATGADNSNPVTGVFYGNHPWDQLKAQFIGSATCIIVVGGFALIMFWVIKQLPGMWNLRISKDGELEGIDIHEHGTPAYHMEFGYGMSYITPTGDGSTVIRINDKVEVPVTVTGFAEGRAVDFRTEPARLREWLDWSRPGSTRRPLAVSAGARRSE